jgi:hypothetical protein
MAWPVMRAHLQMERQELITEFAEKIGEHLGVSGVQEVWQAAVEGKAFKLLVEKDYRVPGFVDTDGYRLLLHPPRSPHTSIPDVVDEIIETVLGKNGSVYFVENDQLRDYGHIALIERYT